MPNPISITGAFGGLNGGLQGALGLDAGKALQDAKHQFGEMRKAGAILSGNPIGAFVNDLIFPDPVADGTLEAAIKREGYISANTLP